MNSGFPAGRVNLDALRRGPVEWSGELPAEAAVWDLGDLDFADGPRLEYRAESGARRGIRVVGRLELTLRVECTRCLAEIRCPVGIEFDYRFDPSVEEWEEEGGVYGLDPEAATLDLVRPLREELGLALPEYPLCREGCMGLCPVCGSDRNESACTCSRTQADPRWDALRQLVSDEQPEAAGPDGDSDGNEG